MQQEVIEIFEKLKFKPSYSAVGNNLIGFRKSFGDLSLCVNFTDVYNFHVAFITYDGIHNIYKDTNTLGDDPEFTIQFIFSELFRQLSDYCLYD
jgi:hypothetical protein